MKECLAVLIAVGISFPLGIMILIYPSGPVQWILKKWALKDLQDSQSRESLSNARLYPGARFTLLEWVEALAEDPVRATHKYLPWVGWLSFVMGTIWLLVTARVAMLIKPVCGPVVQNWLQSWLY